MILAAVSFTVALMPQQPSPGIDRELARERAALLQDVEYDLRFQFVERMEAVSGAISMRWIVMSASAALSAVELLTRLADSAEQ